ncbi:MAG: Spy/CpxP family protein refolding chaperone [Gemmatimonadota bacterium]
MGRRAWLLVSLLTGAAIPLFAQDSAATDDPVRAERLRLLIEDRFAERLSLDLGLTDDQSGKVRVILGTWAGKRRAMEREDRRLRQSLVATMRPGVAANPDSVTRLVDAMTSARIGYAQTFRDELKDLSAVLSPVQRGQYVLLRDRFLQRIQEVRAERQEAAGRRPRLRP